MAGEIVALAGGIGAARFLEGLVTVAPPERVVIIGNTGDDLELHGLYICPDLDTVAYTLSGNVNPERGWGIAGDTFSCLEALSRLGAETWFGLGDRDLATHLFRTEMLRGGLPLSEATRRITEALGVRARLLPATDQRCRTRIQTDAGLLDFQVYFVQRKAEDRVLGIIFDGAEQARPAPGVLEALQACVRRGIHAAVIVSSGFREAGLDGAALEAEILRVAKMSKVRLIGPNCIGLLDTHLPLDTTFLPPPMPAAGDVAFISQSGAICAAIIDWARGQGF
ncbi:MAG: 2-phospho-L-lactate transferase CofD family protein, partial [Acidobacteria bacterium]|nr:2-phospho-L-lactate transferase CofD family protein [Acidobacteriota bacterium]